MVDSRFFFLFFSFDREIDEQQCDSTLSLHSFTDTDKVGHVLDDDLFRFFFVCVCVFFLFGFRFGSARPTRLEGQSRPVRLRVVRKWRCLPGGLIERNKKKREKTIAISFCYQLPATELMRCGFFTDAGLFFSHFFLGHQLVPCETWKRRSM